MENCAFFGLGILVSFLLLRFSYFEFEWRVNVLNFLTVVLTFVVTFHLNHAITHRAGDDRVEKQIIIKQAEALDATLSKISEICRASSQNELATDEARRVLLDFRSLNNQLFAIEKLFRMTPICPDSKKITELRRLFLTLKIEATGGKFPNYPILPEEYRKVQERISSISQAIFGLIVYINRL